MRSGSVVILTNGIGCHLMIQATATSAKENVLCIAKMKSLQRQPSWVAGSVIVGTWRVQKGSCQPLHFEKDYCFRISADYCYTVADCPTDENIEYVCLIGVSEEGVHPADQLAGKGAFK